MKQREHSLYMFEGYLAAYAEFISFCQLAGPGDIGFCVGPGGAGKSEMAALIVEAVYGSEEAWLPGTQPYVHVGADLYEQSFFTPKAFMRRLLQELKDPFSCERTDAVSWRADPSVRSALLSRSRYERKVSQTEAEMRTAFISIARLLKVNLIIVDEANMFLISPRSRTPTDYLESLRRLGDQVGCPIVLFGTTDLLQLLDYSAQLNRRINKIYIEHMKCRNDQEKADFLAFLSGIERDFSLEVGLLTKNAGKIFEWTYGIPGEIVGLVEKSRYKLARRRGPEEIDLQALSEARKSDAELRRCIVEADAIETAMTNLPPTQASAPTSKGSSSKKRRKPKLIQNGGPGEA